MRRWQDAADRLLGSAYAPDPGGTSDSGLPGIGDVDDRVGRGSREPAAHTRVAELARAHDALQAVTDALAMAHGLDEIVPTVLAIVARTFGVEAAAYFEHTGAEDELVFLRYWLFEGRVLRANELLAADPTTPRRWVDGSLCPRRTRWRRDPPRSPGRSSSTTPRALRSPNSTTGLGRTAGSWSSTSPA